ncbi:MAG: S-layer protein [uncultured bacterium (gcode 4)]|uniref:S-layer protein n=1 Tax=uncultured bacterium (gcode 4) TaxID=1234023 RepID=K2G643_9BACT|nr:MAG: S-layer protein [uncultured bacterium (gcode 4)]
MNRKKILSIALAISAALYSHANANIENFNMRVSDGTSYETWTSFTDSPLSVQVWKRLDFETIIQTNSWSWAYTYSANFWNWFLKAWPYSYNIARWNVATCSPTWIQSLDSLFSFGMPDADCIIEIYTKYNAAALWNHNIQLLATWPGTTTLLSTLSVNAIWGPAIVNASSLSKFNNWIIDSVLITTSSSSSINSFSWILIDWNPPTSITAVWTSGTAWELWFPWVIWTDYVPSLSWNFWQQTIDWSVSAQDKTAPFPSLSNSGWTFTWSQTISISMDEAWNIYYALTWSFLPYSSPLTINSNTTLSVKTIDRLFNEAIKNYSYNFVCPNQAPSNATLSAYPACVTICNVWYHLSWGSCAANVVAQPSSWGGGGGGWGWMTLDNCPQWDFSPNQFDGICWASPTSWTWQTGSIWSGNTVIPPYVWEDYSIAYQGLSPISSMSWSTLEKTYFRNLSDATAYLKGRLKDSKVLASVDATEKTIRFDWIWYYLTYDTDFARAYNKIINQYVLYFILADEFATSGLSLEKKSELLGLIWEMKNWAAIVEVESKIIKAWFTDIDSSFAKNDAIYLALKWIVKWYSGNLFMPDKSITRAEYLWIVMKSFWIAVTDNLTDTKFSDIPSWWEWMIKYIEKAKEYWINWQVINWKPVFRPNDPITRAEAIAILFNISGISSGNATVSEFADLPKDSSWMIKYTVKAKELWFAGWQVISWELRFRPNDPITRAESSRILTKALTYKKYWIQE